MKINWIGSFSQGTGFSGASENICIALEKAGVDVRLISFGKDHPKNVTPEGQKIKSKPFEFADVGICFGHPNAFTSLHNKIKIGFTMWETDKFPVGDNEWAGGDPVKTINGLNALLVPCEHNKQLFKSAGVKIPIHVVHLGVDTSFYKPLYRPKNHKPYTFLMLGTLTIRKNPGYVIAAFLTLFKSSPDVKLILKTQAGTLGHLTMPYSNIEIVDRLSTLEEQINYFNEADCFVWPSRGEGFGLPPLEAMATGMPVITAKNTGMLEYAFDDYVYTIRPKGKSRAIRFPVEFGDVGNWYESSFADLKKKMLYVYTHQDDAREKGLKASEWVQKEWTFDQTAKRIVDIVKSLI